MKEAVSENLVEKGLRRPPQNIPRREPGLFQRRKVVDSGAFDPFQCHDPPPGEHPVDLRYLETGIVLRVLAQFGSGGGLEPQIQFDIDRRLEGADDLLGAQSPQGRPRAFQQAGEPQEQIDILAEPGFDLRPQHFDRDLLAVMRFREMDLGDRCRRDGHIVELAEQIIDRRRKFLFDRFARDGSRERRQPVLQGGQIVGDFLADQVGADGKRLSQLDEGRPQLFQRRRKAYARPVGRLLSRNAFREPDDAGCDPQPFQREKRVMPR